MGDEFPQIEKNLFKHPLLVTTQVQGLKVPGSRFKMNKN
jgi:hypothetical protein